MKIFIIIIAVTVVALVFRFLISRDKPENNTSRPSEGKIPLAEKENDKIILIENVSYDNIKKVLTEFCNLYNKNDYAALPRLWQLSSNSFAVTFPFDVDFVTYCFAVNFLKYPMDVKWDAQVRAWTTTKTGDEWITDKSVNKKVMLYLAKDDKEYDNVFLTTQDGVGYKLGFAMGQTKKLLSSPEENYSSPRITTIDLKDQKHEDFK